MSNKVKILIITVFVILFLFPQVVTAQVLINEFYPKNPEWVEFINTGGLEVNLDGYYFDDDIDFNSDTGSSTKIKLQGIFPAGSSCYWEMNSFLNDGGDNSTLFAPNGDTLDTYSYASSSASLSYSRVPDGGDWQVDVVPTKTVISCLSLLTPSPTPDPTAAPTSNPTSTPIPTSTPVKTPTPTPKKSPTPSPTPLPSETPVPELGTNPPINLLGVATESGGMIDKKRPPIIPIILIGTGAIFIIYAGLALAKKNKSEYNLKDENIT